MSLLDILDLVIGIIFIYFILSLMCSSVLELTSNFTKLRAKHLRDWVFSTFSQKGSVSKVSLWDWMRDKKRDDKRDKHCLGQKVWNHFLIDGLSQAGKKVSYIPSSEFVRAIFDIVVHDVNPGRLTGYDIKELEESIAITSLLTDDQKRTFLQYIREANGELIEVRRSFEAWFDQAMERLSGGYKRFSQRFLLGIGLLFTGVLNIDTIQLSKFLYHNPQARVELANAASSAAKDQEYLKAVDELKKRVSEIRRAAADSAITNRANVGGDTVSLKDLVIDLRHNLSRVNQLKDSLNNLSLPLGWSGHYKEINWFSKIGGLLITGFALSFGATFWFDVLNKLVNLRSSGKKPAKMRNAIRP